MKAKMRAGFLPLQTVTGKIIKPLIIGIVEDKVGWRYVVIDKKGEEHLLGYFIEKVNGKQPLLSFNRKIK